MVPERIVSARVGANFTRQGLYRTQRMRRTNFEMMKKICGGLWFLDGKFC